MTLQAIEHTEENYKILIIMEAIQIINGTEFRYEILSLEGIFFGDKLYRVKNKDTGYITKLWKSEIKIL